MLIRSTIVALAGNSQITAMRSIVLLRNNKVFNNQKIKTK
jgi:hypothetical protein